MGAGVRFLKAAEDYPFDGFADDTEEVYRTPAFRVCVCRFVGFWDWNYGGFLPIRGVTAGSQDDCVYVAQACGVGSVKDAE